MISFLSTIALAIFVLGTINSSMDKHDANKKQSQKQSQEQKQEQNK